MAYFKTVPVLTQAINRMDISRVPDENGVSRLYNMLEIHHSGPEPSKFCLSNSSDNIMDDHDGGINSIPIYGHCVSFSPLREHTGVRHSLPMYRFLFFFFFLLYSHC